MPIGRGTEKQKKAFEFFRKHYSSHQPFTLQEFRDATGWMGTSPQTYLSKQYAVFVEKLHDGRYRASQAFRRYASWRMFRQLVTQTRRSPSYEYLRSNQVLMYEFLLPLSNEEHLKGALDALFHKDTIEARLGAIPPGHLSPYFPMEEGETRNRQTERICSWLSEVFIGYSVYHVQGRFRVSPLATRLAATALQENGERYLVDETTAIARFIFPCQEDSEVQRIEFFFHELFVKSILEVVGGQDEIWMVETGIHNRVHRWRAKGE